MLKDMLGSGGTAILLQESRSLLANVRVEQAADAYQMIYSRSGAASSAAPIDILGDADILAMRSLAEATNPGPFRLRMHEVGRFIGIKQSGELVAMAGDGCAWMAIRR
jgi:hypothetical protein